MKTRIQLTVLLFLEFAVWGAYLTSMGTYLAKNGLASEIGWFYSAQGLASLCMPALIGIIADRWVPAQRMLGICHLIAGLMMLTTSYYGYTCSPGTLSFPTLFTCYMLSIAFYMPTIALGNSVAYSVLERGGFDTVKTFPSIRVWGTVGFIVSMWVVDLAGIQDSALQFGFSGLLSICMALSTLFLPHCPVARKGQHKSLYESLGLHAFSLFRNYRMALFFVFSMLLGVCLQITNGFANPFISAFGQIQEYAQTFGVAHANILISLSQISETLCILLIPFFLGRFGIKRVMLIAMLAWVLRFALFAVGNPGGGVWLFVLSMIVYGVAFDFFNISGSLFVDRETDDNIRNSAQGLFMMMTNGFGSTVGMMVAQQVINRYVYDLPSGTPGLQVMEGWSTCWTIFAVYALVVALCFAVLFRYNHQPKQ